MTATTAVIAREGMSAAKRSMGTNPNRMNTVDSAPHISEKPRLT